MSSFRIVEEKFCRYAKEGGLDLLVERFEDREEMVFSRRKPGGPWLQRKVNAHQVAEYTTWVLWESQVWRKADFDFDNPPDVSRAYPVDATLDTVYETKKEPEDMRDLELMGRLQDQYNAEREKCLAQSGRFDMRRYPHTCGCGAAAYIGLTSHTCTNPECEHYEA